MIKHLTIFLIVSLATILLGTCLSKDPGYILLIFHHWQLETSFVVFFLGLLLVLIFLQFGAQSLKFIFFAPLKIKKIIQYMLNRADNKSIQTGIQAYFQENWLLAIKKLSHQKHLPWSLDLLTAEAALQQGDTKTFEKLIKQALESNPKARDSIFLFQSKLYIEHKLFEHGQACLNKINAAFHHLALFQILKLKLEIQFHQYEEGLKRLQLNLKKLQNHKEFFNFYKICLFHQLKTYIEQERISEALQVYKSSPQKLQEDTDIIASFLPKLKTNSKELKYIIKIIKLKLASHACKKILSVVSELPDTALWIKELEKINTPHRKPDVLKTLAELKARQKLWGSAINLLEESIELNPAAETYQALANIYLQINQKEQALICFEKSTHGEF